MSGRSHYNALILGSGQAGTPLATYLREHKESVCLVERAHVGGCCVNEGCTPTKTMVGSGRVAYLARRGREYGVHVDDDAHVKVAMEEVRRRKRDIVESFRSGGENRLRNAGVDVVVGEAHFTGMKEVEVLSQRNEKRSITADRVFINVGCRPSRPDIPGLDRIEKERVLDSTSIQELGAVPKHLVVIGGGYIGLEFAQLMRRLGSEVTIVHRGSHLLSRNDDPELVQCLHDILVQDGVFIALEASSTTLAPSEQAPDFPIFVTATTVSGAHTNTLETRASHILLATGRVPNTDSLALSATGVKTTPQGHVQANEKLETRVEGVYALGDVKGGPAFTHVSYDDFRILRDNLALRGSKTEGVGRTTEARARLVPSVIYTDPQFAHIGPKWGDLPKGKKLVTYRMPASWIARGLETDETRGMLKAVIDPDTDRIVSFSAIAVEGGELMAVVQMAMMGGLTWMDLRDAVFAHPSWAESLNNLWSGERREVVIE